MLRPSTIERIDAHWCVHLGCALADLRDDRITVMAHGGRLAGYRGVYALRALADGGLVIATPPEHLATFQAAVRGETPVAAFDAQCIAGVLGAHAGVVIGPASLAYMDKASFRPVAGAQSVRVLTDGDVTAIEELRDACDPVEWEHADIDPARNCVYGVFTGHTLVAAASREARGDVCNAGVVTHPAHRGRGYGTAAASAVTQGLLDQGALPQWQTLLDNAPSLRIGQALGYVERYRSIAVRLA
jgi:GNAT superfamily N-acetyltransferase